MAKKNVSKLLKTKAPWEQTATLSKPDGMSPIRGKDRFGRSRAKLNSLLEEARSAPCMDDFLDAYSRFTAYCAYIGKPYLTGRSSDDRMLLAAIGVASESGELLDQFKKVYFHDKARKGTFAKERREKIVLEAGDVFWYIDVLLRELGLSWRDVLEANMKKLVNK